MLVAAGETGVEAVPARLSGREETPVRPGRQRGIELVTGLDRDAPRPEMRTEGAIAATDVLHDVVAAALGEQHARPRGEPFTLAAHHHTRSSGLPDGSLNWTTPR